MDIKTHNLDDLRPVLLELIEGGMRQAEIAREIGLTRATVNIVLKKQDTWMPRYETGRRLMDLLHRRRKARHA